MLDYKSGVLSSITGLGLSFLVYWKAISTTNLHRITAFRFQLHRCVLSGGLWQMRGGPGIKNCCPWKRKNAGLIQYFSDSDLLSTGIRIQTLSSSLWTCLRCRLTKCSSTKSTKQSNKVPNQSWRSLTDYLTIWWNWHGKLVHNFSHESDVMSLQDSFTSRPWKTPFCFIIVFHVNNEKASSFNSCRYSPSSRLSCLRSCSLRPCD